MMQFPRFHAVLPLSFTLVFLFVFSSRINAQHADLESSILDLIKASREGDSEAMIDWFHPEYVELSGGKEKLLRKGFLDALKFNKLQEVMEPMGLDGRNYAAVSTEATLKKSLEEMRGKGGMGMAIATMMMKLEVEHGEENVNFDEKTYELSISGIEITMIAVQDPAYSGWRFLPLKEKRAKEIIPPQVITYFEDLQTQKLTGEIEAAASIFLKVIAREGPEAEASLFTDAEVPDILEGTRGLDQFFSFEKLDTIYRIGKYKDAYFAVLGFSGDKTPEDQWNPNSPDPNKDKAIEVLEDGTNPYPLYLADGRAIILAGRKANESNWQFGWQYEFFRYLPHHINPFEIMKGVEAKREEEKRAKERIGFNKTIDAISKTVKQRYLEGNWSGADGYGLTNMIFRADKTYTENYINERGYRNESEGEYEYLEETGMYMLRERGREQYLKFLGEDQVVVEAHNAEEFSKYQVFWPKTRGIMLRDDLPSDREYNKAVWEELLEKQRQILFGLMRQSGMRVFWSDKNVLKELNCEGRLQNKQAYSVSFEDSSLWNLEYQMDLWEGRMPEWNEQACVITYELARLITDKENDIPNLIGTDFPCEPGLTIMGILKPNERYDHEQIPKSLPILFLSE